MSEVRRQSCEKGGSARFSRAASPSSRRSDGGFGLKVKLVVEMPGVDKATVQMIAERGHFICPYSNATKGNIEVETEVV